MTKVYIQTFGCSLNHADSESMRGVLDSQGYEEAKTMDEADIIILNSCAVKGPTESKFFTLLGKLKKQGKKVIVGGCIPGSMPEKLKDTSIIGTEQIGAIGDAVAATANNEIISLLEDTHNNKIAIPSKRVNPLVEIIPICAGCLSACTYCITKKARGNLTSYPPEDIIKRARKAKNEGVKEIYLTSPDNGCYGFDIKTNVAKLVKEIIQTKGEYKIRIGMGNPQHFIKFVDELIEVLKHPNVYKFVHIPVQAGNNQVLKDMLRGYSIELYEEVVLKIKKEVPHVTIATDIIVGFPTETEEQFQDTLTHLERVQPDIVNISRFWPRPHTAAEKLKELPGDIVKERSKKTTATYEKYMLENNTKYLNTKQKILITEKGKNNTFIGRMDNYKQVIVPGQVEIGKEYEAKITGAEVYYLFGEVNIPKKSQSSLVQIKI